MVDPFALSGWRRACHRPECKVCRRAVSEPHAVNADLSVAVGACVWRNPPVASPCNTVSADIHPTTKLKRAGAASHDTPAAGRWLRLGRGRDFFQGLLGLRDGQPVGLVVRCGAQLGAELDLLEVGDREEGVFLHISCEPQ